MDLSNKKIKYSANTNLINAAIGCCINAIIAFPIHIFLSSLSIYCHALYGIQIALVIIGGIPGSIIVISVIQRMNISDYSIGDEMSSERLSEMMDEMMMAEKLRTSQPSSGSGKSAQPKLLEDLMTLPAKALGKLILFLMQFRVEALHIRLKPLGRFGSLLMAFGGFGGLMILGIVISEAMRLFLPIILFWGFLQVLFKSYKFLHHINTSSDWKTPDISSSIPVIQWMYGQMDIEFKAYLIDQKSTWVKLTPRQIQTKEVLFILGYYQGVFTHWVRSVISNSILKMK
jgi:hypothetical protein